MPFAQDFADLLRDGIALRKVGDFDIDDVDVAAAAKAPRVGETRLRGRQRNDDLGVLTEKTRAAFAFHDTLDAKRHIVDAYGLPDGVRVGEKFGGNGAAQTGNARTRAHVRRIDKFTR